MKTLFLVLSLVLLAGQINGLDADLPMSLKELERFIEDVSKENRPRSKDDSTICITVATGSSTTVRKIFDFELNHDATILDADGAHWKSEHRPLVGWQQGLVVLLRKSEKGFERFSWSQRELRDKASEIQLRDGDWLISLIYPDI